MAKKWRLIPHPDSENISFLIIGLNNGKIFQ